jgi:hypothetical protein
VTFVFFAAIALIVYVGAVFIYRAATGDLHYLVSASITPGSVGRLPSGVQPVGEFSVAFMARHIPLSLVALTAVHPAIFAAAALVAVWMLRGLIKTARDGDPFVTENVRRLRVIGVILLVYSPLEQVTHALIQSLYINRVSGLAKVLEPQGIVINVTVVLVGVSLLALAQVFARGIELRSRPRRNDLDAVRG